VGRPFQLVQPADLRMVGGQPVGEHADGLGAGRDRGGAEHGADGLDVADDLAADRRLDDPLGLLDGAVRRAAGAAGWGRGEAQLPAGLPDGEQALGRVQASRCAQVGCLLHVTGEPGEVILGQLVEGLAGRQAHHRQGVPAHLAGPAGAPAQPLADLGHPGGVAGVGRVPHRGELDAAGLGQQQFGIGPQMPLDEAPHHERPGVGPVQVQQAGRGRPGHPRPKVWVAGQQPARGPPPGIPAAVVDRQAGDVPIVGGEQVHAPLEGARASGGNGHGAARLALAYSAASASGDRCTYAAVVSGLACPISSRSASRSIPAWASWVPKVWRSRCGRTLVAPERVRWVRKIRRIPASVMACPAVGPRSTTKHCGVKHPGGRSLRR
jgi:hypothetical protein